MLFPLIASPLVLLLTPAAADVPVTSWAAALDRAKAEPAMAEAVAEIVAEAEKALEKPVIRRVYTLEDVGKHRTWLDGRSNALEDEIRQTFALAMSDFGACNALAGELPVLAAAYRLTGKEAFGERVVAQLEEMTSWSPLQRPGWTCYHPGARLPEDGKDGNWLATGCGVRAIGDALDIMPEGAIDPALRKRLDALLEKEVASIVDDWRTKRSWFISSDNPITNQWVLPTEGLVRACILLGREEHPEAYELGVGNLLKALNVHGPNGEFEEGVGYASFTVTSLAHAAHAMSLAGDHRALEHPFLTRFPLWLVHHVLPGDMLINCFDAGSCLGAGARLRPLLSLLAACTGSPEARWGLAELCGGPSNDLPGLVARSLPETPLEAPPLFAVYEHAARVNWRDSWRPDGCGVWVRGGHRLDQHDHQDRGHVNFIAGGKPILIEAGTPSYDNRLMMTHYSTGVGHNVLQLGTEFPVALADAGEHVHLPGWQDRGTLAPIRVERLDEKGGDVVVEVTNGYDDLVKWERRVTWTADNVKVLDAVRLAEGTQNTVLFRWHLGTRADAALSENQGAHTVSWDNVTMTLTAPEPITLTQEKLPDNTLDHADDEEPLHTCIVVRSAEATGVFQMTTEVAVE